MTRDPLGWTDLNVEHLEALGPDDFEQFCFDLIGYEAYDRHDSPGLDGPAGRSVADGGRDVLLTVKRSPITPKVDYQRAHHLSPLTEDVQARTVYSCKSGKNWLDLALGDVRNRKNPGRAIEVLLEGGYFKLLINVIGKLDDRIERNGVKQPPPPAPRRRALEAHEAGAAGRGGSQRAHRDPGRPRARRLPARA